MSFFLNAHDRIYSRYGSRVSTSAPNHNSPDGLLHTLKEVLRVHKEESAKEKPEFDMPTTRPEDIPMFRIIGYTGSCGRCHMVNEALATEKRKAGQRGASWFYPLPDNVGIKL